jgi:hypothetical protein
MFPELKRISDTDPNDSDKTLFTTPDGEVYEVLWIYCELSTSSAVGNRRLSVQIRDADNDVVAEFYSAQVITANVSNYIDVFMPGGTGTGVGKGAEVQPLPQPTLIPAGFDVRVYDVAVIDPTHDDLVIHAMVRRYQLE